MIANPHPQSMTANEYLEWEPQQDIRYEFVGGHLQAMTGGTVPHNLITLNLYSALRSHLRNRSCRAFVSDVKLQINNAGLYRYPDVMVSCDERDRDAIQFIRYPTLIVEVLSPGTEASDRGDKFAEYRHLSTLQEYVLVGSEKISVECFRRRDGGFWVYQPYAEGDDIFLESIQLDCPIRLLYDDVQYHSTERETS
jgi:Uma2 family endonuclease